ncbi:putative uncharacterized protein [Burkholderiales bacterium GJ-E10]|nr:putative uncharacterized protein [Burkholderiales bacterium GJ-E10]
MASVFVQFRVTQEDHQIVEQAAAREGMSVGLYCRNVSISAAQGVAQELEISTNLREISAGISRLEREISEARAGMQNVVRTGIASAAGMPGIDQKTAQILAAIVRHARIDFSKSSPAEVARIAHYLATSWTSRAAANNPDAQAQEVVKKGRELLSAAGVAIG